MSTPGNCVIPPDVGELSKRSPAEQAPPDVNASSRSLEKSSESDYENVIPDRPFLMALLRALSAWST
jgi:hypothetical protein